MLKMKKEKSIFRSLREYDFFQEVLMKELAKTIIKLIKYINDLGHGINVPSLMSEDVRKIFYKK